MFQVFKREYDYEESWSWPMEGFVYPTDDEAATKCQQLEDANPFPEYSYYYEEV